MLEKMKKTVDCHLDFETSLDILNGHTFCILRGNGGNRRRGSRLQSQASAYLRKKINSTSATSRKDSTRDLSTSSIRKV